MEGASGAVRVRAMYRRMLELVSRLHDADARARGVAQVRAAFRASSAERDPAAIDSLLQTAREKLTYLRMITPRRAGDDGGGGDGGGGSGRFAVYAGEVRSVGAAEDERVGTNGLHSSFAVGAAVDSNALRRHQASLERFRFGGAARQGIPLPRGPVR
jgi:hypothetical protein